MNPPADPEYALPIDPETGLFDWGKVPPECRPPPDEWQRLPPEEEKRWAAFAGGGFRNDAGRILDYYAAVRDGLIKPPWMKGAPKPPWVEEKPKHALEPEPKSTPESESKLPGGAQMSPAIASLKEAFPGGKVPEDMSVERARMKARPYWKPDPKHPDRGFPSPDTYARAIKALGRAPRAR